MLVERFRLDKFLDEGGFGAVYRATQLALGRELREVAVKLAKRPWSAEQARETFEESLTMIRVVESSPDATMRQHFVSVLDVGCCPAGGPLEGHPFVVMELVHGGSLKGHLRLGAYPLTRAINCFDQILKAVAFMHGTATHGGEPRQPIIHRDLKPGNILVVRQPDGTEVLKVSDFGLAIAVDSLLDWVDDGGDLAHLAPESFSQKICSRQTDVYMLGLIFYEMISGETPFGEVGRHLRGSDEEKHRELCRLHLAARQMEKFRALERHEELRLRPGLAKVIRTALQMDKIARTYQDAGELLGAWNEAKKGNETGAAETPWQSVRRLTGEAEQCFAVGDEARGDALLSAAMQMNRDAKRVPDSVLVGRAYLLVVRRRLTQGDLTTAGTLATEGYRRRKCRSTCQAMHAWYAAQKSPAAARFQQEANQCDDRE